MLPFKAEKEGVERVVDGHSTIAAAAAYGRVPRMGRCSKSLEANGGNNRNFFLSAKNLDQI